MKFYLDQNLSPIIATAARALGEDVTDWRTDGMTGASDAEQVSHVIQEGRRLVTLDQVDFIAVSEARRATGAAHFDVLVVHARLTRADSVRVAAALQNYAAQHPDGAWKNSVEALHIPDRRG